MSSDGSHLTGATPGRQRATAALAGVSRRERLLWTLVVVALVGDILTTYYGLKLGLSESNPVVRAAIGQYGFGAMVGIKLFAVGVGLVCRWLLPEKHGLLVPAGLAVPWSAAALVNLSLYVLV